MDICVIKQDLHKDLVAMYKNLNWPFKSPHDEEPKIHTSVTNVT